MRFSWLLFLSTTLFAENPWGKDADLICASKPAPPPQVEFSIVKKFASSLINFHQDVVSPIDGPRSHFFPSSSQYTKEAIQKYGFFLGVALGCDRLMRENDDPWVYQPALSPDGRKLKLNLIP